MENNIYSNSYIKGGVSNPIDPNSSTPITFSGGGWQIYYPTVTLTSTGVNVKKIFINNNRLVVLWSDNTRTMSTCGNNDVFDPEVGFAICLAKKIYGKKKYQRMLKKAEVQDNNDKLLKEFKKHTINL